MRDMLMRESISEIGEGNRLHGILHATRLRLACLKKAARPLEWEEIATQHIPRRFKKRLEETSRLGPAVIAELKKACPAKGPFREMLPVRQLAKQLAQAGASALSVLTDEPFFQGSIGNLLEASTSCSLPCLRKD